MNLTKIVLNNLRQLESERRMNQTEFAKHCGLHQRTYNRYFTDESIPKITYLEQIAQKNRIDFWRIFAENLGDIVSNEVSRENTSIQQIAPTFNNDTIYSISQLDEDSYKLLESVVVDFLCSDDEARKASQILVAGQKSLSDQRSQAAKVKMKVISKGFDRASITRKEESKR